MKPLIQCSNITKSFGERQILTDVSVCINEGQRIGLIGCNGAGKTTFANIMTGREPSDGGSIVRSNHLRISYLEQHAGYLPDESVIDFLMRRADKPEWQCAKMAHRFQLDETICAAPIAELSGGYRTRVNLAAALLNEPNLLVLDEPTNYLDVSTMVLLEKFLSNIDISCLIISHDRAFLRNTCNHILELEHGEATMFPGTIDQFLIFKHDKITHKQQHNRNITAKRKNLQEFVDRFKSKSSKARQAQSVVKQINRLEELKPERVSKTANIVIPPVLVKKGAAFDCEDLTIGYPDHTIARDINTTIMRGAHVAIIGNNGEGKTTFLRTLAGDLPPLGGTRKRNGELNIGYFAQHVYAELNRDETVYKYLFKKSAPSVSEQEIKTLAGGFLFHGDDIKKPIGVLSGGERARVCLAGMLLAKNDILLLDEPTNHLDVETVEALADALAAFNGTVLVVSHDREFIKKISTDIIEVAHGKIKPYPGTYEEYLYYLEHMVGQDSSGLKTPTNKGNRKSSDKKEKVVPVKELRQQIRVIEKDITRLEKQRDRYHREFAANPNYSEKKQRDYKKVLSDISEKEKAWGIFTDQLDS